MGNAIPDWPRQRGDLRLISEMTNVPRETVRRIVSGEAKSARYEFVQAVSAAVATLAKEREPTQSSEETDEKQTKSRKSSAAAAKAGA